MFGCSTYTHVRDGKLEPRAKKYIFLGYASGVKGYRLWCNDTKSPELIISRNVIFIESALLDGGRSQYQNQIMVSENR